MTITQLYSLCGAALFGIGLWSVVAMPHLLRKVIGLNVMGVGVFLVFVAMAARTGGSEPDAVPHAMVLTGVVVAVSATALALALIRRLYRETGRVTLPPTDGSGEDHGHG